MSPFIQRSDHGDVPSDRPAQTDDTVTIPVSAVLGADSPRLAGENAEHVRLLAAVDTALPPILVHRQTMRVIDGMHRVRAAILKGQQDVSIRFFDGTESEAFVAAVASNTSHGLPLSLADREAAAARLVQEDPRRSDRWIASITGLAAGTVAVIRARVSPQDELIPDRIGRDGKVRPLSSADGRRRAREEIMRRPEASLREIARVVGISPATVRDVKERLQRGDDPVPAQPAAIERIVPAARQQGENRPESKNVKKIGHYAKPDYGSLLRTLEQDPSLRFSETGRALLRWLNARATGPGTWHELIDGVPPHVSYVIIKVARCCAEEWKDLATQLEQRVRDIEEPA